MSSVRWKVFKCPRDRVMQLSQMYLLHTVCSVHMTSLGPVRAHE